MIVSCFFLGESVPVTKTALSSSVGPSGDSTDMYSSASHKRNTLFCGTQVLQTRPEGNQAVRAIVVQTGKIHYKIRPTLKIDETQDLRCC